MRRDNGFALVTVLIIFVLLLAIGGIMLNIVKNTTKISYSTVKYETAMEAASSGIELGISQILVSLSEGNTPDGTISVKLGNYKVNVTIQKILTARAKGTEISFAGGYQGAGKGGGQYFIYFLITSKARGKSGESFIIEANYKSIIKSY